MKKTLLCILGAVGALYAGAEEAAISPATPEAAWWALIDGTTSAGDQANDVAISSTGDVYWFGVYGSTETDPDVYYNGEKLFQGALYNAGTSYNNNFTLIKTDSEGHKLWTVYSNSGDFATNSGFVSATSDGGAIVVSKVRHTDGMTDRDINFVDATGADYTVAWTCDRRSYRIFVTKISGDGIVEWNRMIDASTEAGPAASGNYATFWADTFNLTGGTTDEEGNIYIALNYRNPLTITSENGENVVLTPKNTTNWSGDTQVAAGDFLLLGLDNQGYYRNNLQLIGDGSVSYCQQIEYADGKLYAQGYITGEEGKTLSVGSFSLAPSTVMSPLVLSLDTDFRVNWAKCYPAEKVGGKYALQNVGISVINGSVYMCGQYNLKFSDPDDSAKYVAATQGTLREGFVLRLDAIDGSWLAARNSRDDDWNNPSAAAKTGLTGYFKVIPNPLSAEKVYVYGYVMNAAVGVFLREYDANTLVGDLSGQYNIVTGGGVPSCQCIEYDANEQAAYITARGNKAFNLMVDQTTEAPTGWAILAARFDLPKLVTGIAESVVNDVESPVEYYTLQGVRIENPSQGIYICRQGNKVSKIVK